MRNKLFLLSFLFCVSSNAFTQVTVNGSFVHDGIVRTYSYYVPAIYNSDQEVPLIIDLHGLGSDGATHAVRSNFQAIADTANFIVVHPDGTPDVFLGQRFWNYENILGSTVDDAGFLVALIDTISAHCSINQNRVYCSGMSNGSFMAYYLACYTDRFAAIGAVTGSMSVNMYNDCSPSRPTPTIHVHGTTDPINTYSGTSTMKAIEDVSLYWANQNGCSTTPIITPVPNINTVDNATAERHLFAGGVNNHTVELFKVIDGGHTWPGYYVFTFNGNTCMDFSASKELWRFFSQHEISTSIGLIEENTLVEIEMWPNPTSQFVHFKSNDRVIKKVLIIDLLGRVVENYSNEKIDMIDVSHLQQGNYSMKVSGNDFSVVKKLMISNPK